MHRVQRSQDTAFSQWQSSCSLVKLIIKKLKEKRMTLQTVNISLKNEGFAIDVSLLETAEGHDAMELLILLTLALNFSSH